MKSEVNRIKRIDPRVVGCCWLVDRKETGCKNQDSRL